MKRTREQIRESMQNSHMHRRIYAAISKLCAEKHIQVFFDKEFVLLSTYPDLYFPSRGLTVYVDGPIHKGNQLDKDNELRIMLGKRVKVVSMKYDADTDQEFERLMKEIMSWLE